MSNLHNPPSDIFDWAKRNLSKILITDELPLDFMELRWLMGTMVAELPLVSMPLYELLPWFKAKLTDHIITGEYRLEGDVLAELRGKTTFWFSQGVVSASDFPEGMTLLAFVTLIETKLGREPPKPWELRGPPGTE